MRPMCWVVQVSFDDCGNLVARFPPTKESKAYTKTFSGAAKADLFLAAMGKHHRMVMKPEEFKKEKVDLFTLIGLKA